MPFTHLTETLPVKQQVFDGSSVSVGLPTKSPVSLVLVSLWWIGCCQLPERRAVPTERLQPDRAGGQRQQCQGLRAEERGKEAAGSGSNAEDKVAHYSILKDPAFSSLWSCQTWKYFC